MQSEIPSCWSMNNMRPTPEPTFPLDLPSSLSLSQEVFSQYPQPSTHGLSVTSLQDNQESPGSWSQLLLRGLMGDEENYGSTTSAPNFPAKKMLDNWEDQVLYSSQMAHDHVKHDYSSANGFVLSHLHDDDGKIQQASGKIQQASNTCPRNHQVLPTISSPRSCLTASFKRKVLDFSNNKEKGQLHQPDNSPECNSTATGAAYKKARVKHSSSLQQTTFKVRNEKLGGRITALHQLVSPFGKTDTASVLQEANGYIRFLQNQIEALSSPYLANGSGNKRQSVQGDHKKCLFPEDPGQQDGTNVKPKKDLRSRGLCLVPVSFTLRVGSENGADFWTPAYGGCFC